MLRMAPKDMYSEIFPFFYLLSFNLFNLFKIQLFTFFLFSHCSAQVQLGAMSYNI